MIKVQILDHCENCEGEAYLPVGEAESYTGEQYTRYEPCTQCQGSGKQTRWISLPEFADLMDRAIAFEPDYKELAKQTPVTEYQDSLDSAF